MTARVALVPPGHRGSRRWDRDHPPAGSTGSHHGGLTGVRGWAGRWSAPRPARRRPSARLAGLQHLLQTVDCLRGRSWRGGPPSLGRLHAHCRAPQPARSRVGGTGTERHHWTWRRLLLQAVLTTRRMRRRFTSEEPLVSRDLRDRTG
jgi:hypothetical protein